MIRLAKKYSLCILALLIQTNVSFAHETSWGIPIPQDPDDDDQATLSDASGFSYDFAQLTLTLSQPKQQQKFAGGLDLGFSIPITPDIFMIASMGSNSINAFWGGFESANVLFGFGLGAGYHMRVLQRFDLIATAELFQAHVRFEGSPKKTSGFNLGIGGRGKIDAQREGLVFINYLNENQANKFSINVQVSHAFSKSLQAVAGFDLANFRSFSLGVRTNF